MAVGILGYLFYLSTKPLPGQKQVYNCDNFMDFSKIPDAGSSSDKCRMHIADGTIVHYATNPPTFGPHYPVWVDPGVYDQPKDDRNLVHSMEHGYVIMSYRCNLGPGTQNPEASGSAIASGSGQLNTQAECDQRKNELSQIYENKGKRKLIVVARPNLDTNFALTAWIYLDKFNNFDEKRIDDFIDGHRDNGPEQTMD